MDGLILFLCLKVRFWTSYEHRDSFWGMKFWWDNSGYYQHFIGGREFYEIALEGSTTFLRFRSENRRLFFYEMEIWGMEENMEQSTILT